VVKDKAATLQLLLKIQKCLGQLTSRDSKRTINALLRPLEKQKSLSFASRLRSLALVTPEFSVFATQAASVQAALPEVAMSGSLEVG